MFLVVELMHAGWFLKLIRRNRKDKKKYCDQRLAWDVTFLDNVIKYSGIYVSKMIDFIEMSDI